MTNCNPGTPLPFERCENFRELGGYQSRNGKHVKQGVFYRSPALYNLRTDADKARFISLGVRHVFDFRSSAERIEQPDIVPQTTILHEICALNDAMGNEVNFHLKEMLKDGRKSVEAMMQTVHEGYERMPFQSQAYRKLFEVICAQETPVLFHCTAGKDRTGIAAALILTALDVPYETIVQDYLITNTCRGQGVMATINALKTCMDEHDAIEVGTVMCGVAKESLDLAFDTIAKRYPTIEAYFEAELGVDAKMLERLREIYLV